MIGELKSRLPLMLSAAGLSRAETPRGWVLNALRVVNFVALLALLTWAAFWVLFLAGAVIVRPYWFPVYHSIAAALSLVLASGALPIIFAVRDSDSRWAVLCSAMSLSLSGILGISYFYNAVFPLFFVGVAVALFTLFDQTPRRHWLRNALFLIALTVSLIFVQGIVIFFALASDGFIA